MRCIRFIGFICLFVMLSSFHAWAQLSINFIAVNPKNKPTEIEIKQYLPRELEPDDIVDAGELKLDFDVQKSSMYAYGKIAFGPKESKTFKIRVNDVWQIKPDEINLLKDQLEKTLEMMKDHENYPSALYVRDMLVNQMDYILKKQEDFTGNIERRIEEYRANISTLEDIRDKVYNQDFLKFESKSVQIQDEEKKTVTMVIEVKNPSNTKSLTVKQKHYLPKEIRSDTVVDAKGFEVRFDDEKQKAYLSKEEDFTPGEVKEYEIVLEDVWQFPDIKLTDLDDRAQIAALELGGTAFEESANRLYENIKKFIAEIRASKELDTSPERHIGLFRLNNRRYEKAYEDFKRIEEMISIVRAKKLQEMERKKVKNVLERLKALRGLKQLSEALFKRKLSMNVTWKIIFGTIGFVAFFTTLHFFMWAKRSKTMGEELAPKSGEGIKVVPKPGEGEEEEEEEA